MLAYAYRNQHEHRQGQIHGPSLGFGRGSSTEANWIQIEDDNLSSLQARLTWQIVEGRISGCELENLGRSIVLSGGPRIHRGGRQEFKLPFSILAGDTQIQFFEPLPQPELDKALTILSKIGSNMNLGMNCQVNTVAPGADTLAAWFESLGDLQSSVTCSHQFFQQAARAAVNPGGLDGGIVLIRKNDGWEIAASYVPYPDYGIFYREDLVEQACQTGMTLFHSSDIVDQVEVPIDIHSSLICPIQTPQADVKAVIYGLRYRHRVNYRRGIRPLEAQFVQVIADSISAGMARMESESEIARTRILLEQAFSPSIAKRLEQDPKIFEGQDREVSILFSDLRDFTSISERIGAKATYELLTDVMDRFSQIVEDNHGIIIDYFGDGLSAFWNAPIDQPDHAMLACKSAMAIEAAMVELNSVWERRIGEPLRVGVGVHSGSAQVGNSGSKRRFKYGPQGSTVNLASRMESVTKHVGHPVLISGETAALVKDQFHCQRVFSTNLKGTTTPTDIYRIQDFAAANKREKRLGKYEVALQEFESDQIASATERWIALLAEDESDRAVEFMVEQTLARKHWDGSEELSLPITALLTREQVQPTSEASSASERNNSNV